uniref:Capsid protein n=1 Tax=Parvoviridae sp. TaxID=1940570 RepID=A0A7D3QPT2_9VIRU|nr:MAG: capsid protein [Parvoviridae sp.]
MTDDGRVSPDSSGPSAKRSRMDSVPEDGAGRSGAGTAAGGGGAGSAAIGTASGNWVGGAQFGSHGVTTRMSRNFSLPIFNNGNYHRINGEASSTMAIDKWSGYATPWGYIDFNRWDLHFSPRAWQKLVNNYRGIKPKTMRVRICNIQVREAVYSGEQTIYNSSPNGSIMAVVDFDGKYPYVLGNMQWGQLSVAPYKVSLLPQYGYTFSGCGDSTGFYCLEGGNCQVLRTGDTTEFTYQFTDAPMLDLCIVAQQANQTANPLLGSYMLRAFGLDKENVSSVSDMRFIAAGKYSVMYQNFLFGNLWQHSLFNGTLASNCEDVEMLEEDETCVTAPVDSGDLEFPIGQTIIGDPRSGDGTEVVKDDGQPLPPEEGCVPSIKEWYPDEEGFTKVTGIRVKNYNEFKDKGALITLNRVSSGYASIQITDNNQYETCPSTSKKSKKTPINSTRINTTAHAPNSTWYKAVSYTSLKNGVDTQTDATYDTIVDGPHGQCWVIDENGISGRPCIPNSYKEGADITWKQQAVSLTDDDWNVSSNPLAGAQSGTSVSQTVRDVLKERAVNVRGIFPGTCWQDKDIWYSGPIWCKIPDISTFHPKPLFGGYGLKHPPPQIFLKNNPIYLPGDPKGGANYICNSFVNQLASGQVSVEIEWECIPDQGVAWGPEDAQTGENFGGYDKYCPDTAGNFVVGSNTQSRTLRKHL